MTQENTHYLIALIKHQGLTFIILLSFTRIPTEAHEDSSHIRLSINIGPVSIDLYAILFLASLCILSWLQMMVLIGTAIVVNIDILLVLKNVCKDHKMGQINLTT